MGRMEVLYSQSLQPVEFRILKQEGIRVSVSGEKGDHAQHSAEK